MPCVRTCSPARFKSDMGRRPCLGVGEGVGRGEGEGVRAGGGESENWVSKDMSDPELNPASVEVQGPGGGCGEDEFPGGPYKMS